MDADTDVMDAAVDDAAVEVDAGVEPDAGGAVDAGMTPDDAGVTPVDGGGTPDASAVVDAGPLCTAESCDDTIACTTDVCTSTGCMHTPSDAACAATERCDPLAGCVPLRCTTPTDCVIPGEVCSSAAVCDTSGACLYEVPDADDDGAGNADCGGTDCDDTDGTIHPGALEACNGVDDDCDGTVDAPLAEGACGPSHECRDGSCQCPVGETACGARCYDLTSSLDHCGTCGTSCRYAHVCDSGSCVCPSGWELCSGWCRDVASDESHCGGCFSGCVTGATCNSGTCECPTGETACRWSCMDLLTSTSSCGACEHRCISGAACASGACSPAYRWSYSYIGYDASGLVHDMWVAPDGTNVITGRFRRQLEHRPTGSTAGGPTVMYGDTDGSLFLLQHSTDGVRNIARSINSSGSSGATGIALADAPGADIYLAGWFTGSIDPGGGTLTSQGSWDVLLARLDADLMPVWQKRLGGSGADFVEDIASDSIGRLAAVGEIDGTYDFGGGSLVSTGTTDGYAVVYAADGSHVGSWRLPGEPLAVEFDTSGAVVVVGRFTGSIDLGGGPITSAGYSDIFVGRYDTAGTHLGSFAVGTAEGEYPAGVAVLGTDLVMSTGEWLLTRVASDGTVRWFIPASASPLATVSDLAIEGADIVIVGHQSGGYDFGGGPLGTSRAGFTVAYDTSGAFQWNIEIVGGELHAPGPVGIDASANVYVAGYHDRDIVLGSAVHEAYPSDDGIFEFSVAP